MVLAFSKYDLELNAELLNRIENIHADVIHIEAINAAGVSDSLECSK